MLDLKIIDGNIRLCFGLLGQLKFWCRGLIVVAIICRGRRCSLIRKKMQLRLQRNKVSHEYVARVDAKDGSIIFKNPITANSSPKHMQQTSITVLQTPLTLAMLMFLAPSKLKVIITK